MEKVLCVVLAVLILVSAVGCGTILHGSVPESRRGHIDWAAFILNFLFFWPGILVDVATGGFWVPKGY